MWHLFDSERQLIKVPSDLCHHVLCIYPEGAVHNSPWQILLFLLQNFIISIKSVNDTQRCEAHTARVNASCSSTKSFMSAAGTSCLQHLHRGTGLSLFYLCSTRQFGWKEQAGFMIGRHVEIQGWNPFPTVLCCVTIICRFSSVCFGFLTCKTRVTHSLASFKSDLTPQPRASLCSSIPNLASSVGASLYFRHVLKVCIVCTGSLFSLWMIRPSGHWYPEFFWLTEVELGHFYSRSC